jgi:DNA primase
VFLAFDDDVAGREATEKIAKLLRSTQHKEQIMLALAKLELPAGKDLGDLTPEEYQRIFNRALKRLKRSL